MPIYYHGTTVPGLTVLKPFASPFSNLKYACVYLSTYKPLAAIYIWNRPYKWFTFDIKEDGTLYYTESFPNNLREFYDGVKGYIYACEGDYSSDSGTGIRYAAISKEPVPVTGCDMVENAYERILQYESEGALILQRFEELTQKEHDMNRKMILNGIRRLNLLEGTHPLSPFVKEKFPDLWAESAAKQ